MPASAARPSFAPPDKFVIHSSPARYPCSHTMPVALATPGQKQQQQALANRPALGSTSMYRTDRKYRRNFPLAASLLAPRRQRRSTHRPEALGTRYRGQVRVPERPAQGPFPACAAGNDPRHRLGIGPGRSAADRRIPPGDSVTACAGREDDGIVSCASASRQAPLRITEGITAPKATGDDFPRKTAPLPGAPRAPLEEEEPSAPAWAPFFALRRLRSLGRGSPGAPARA